MITLVLPQGDHTAPSHGIQSFEPYREDPSDANSRWLVDVPEHAAINLLHNGGYSLPAISMRRRLSGDVMPVIHGDGAEPFSLSYDGDSYSSEPTTMPNGARLNVASIPHEAHAEVLSVHPGMQVLSLADYAAPKRGRKAKEEPAAPRDPTYDGYVSLDKDSEYRLEGGDAARELHPADEPGSPHPDGIVGPAEEAARAKAAAEEADRLFAPSAENKDSGGSSKRQE